MFRVVAGVNGGQLHDLRDRHVLEERVLHAVCFEAAVVACAAGLFDEPVRSREQVAPQLASPPAAFGLRVRDGDQAAMLGMR